MAGSSGATIAIHGGIVTKTGDERVVSQGVMLRSRTSVALPQVFEILDNGYTMERLVEFTGHTPEDVYVLLSDHIWTESHRSMRTPLVPFDRYELSVRLARAVYHVQQPIAQAFQLTNIVAECVDILNASWMYQAAYNDSPPLVATHGDPTMENVMYRRGTHEGLVLIDPLPARPYAPSLREVDLGKVLQSLVGFETDRYELDKVDLNVARRWLTFVCDEEELSPEIVLWWTVVHLLRTFPYVNTATRSRILNNSLRNTLTMIQEARHARYL